MSAAALRNTFAKKLRMRGKKKNQKNRKIIHLIAILDHARPAGIGISISYS